MPLAAGPDLRARLVLEIGTKLGDWAQQLIGIPGLLEIAHRTGQVSAAAVASDTADLVACLAGAWGRSMIAAPRLAPVAPAAQASWVARGAAGGVPSDCVGAAGG